MRSIALALAFVGAACAETAPLDYRPPHDFADAGAAGVPVDAGSAPRDAGHIAPAAGHDPRDAGHVAPDAGRACLSCVPACHNAACGPDGCGGSCGACGDGRVCIDFGDPPNCGIADVPDCTGRECGGDGLGGICGVCPASWQCGLDATCKPAGGGCGSVGASGNCIGGFVVACQGGALVHTRCTFDACAVDASGNAACEPLPCIPDCFGKACGDDGCGGSCGTCAVGGACALGGCLPAAPPPGLAPVCTGRALIEWQSGTGATVTDCLAKGLVCDESCQPAACRPLGNAMPCGALPAAGHCAGDYAFKCVGGAVTVRHCTDWGYGGCKRVGMEKFDCWP